MEYVKSFRELEVYKLSRQLSRDLFELSKKLPKEETYSLSLSEATGNQTKADAAEHVAFCGRHIGIAGADDLIDGLNSIRAEGQRADRLGAADAVNFVNPGNRSGGQDQRVQHPFRGRHDHG